MNQNATMRMRSFFDLKRFIDGSPTQFHAVRTMRDFLVGSHGFEVLPEDSSWEGKLQPGGRYLVIRNGSSIAAFVMGLKPASESGLRIIGAHTDSPGLRLKPLPVYDKKGYVQLGVEPYGGPILASWMNRDLGIAGRLIIERSNGDLCSRLVRLPLTISIPNLAIHLNPRVNDDGLVLNKQLHLPPILGLTDSDVASGARFKGLLASAGEIRADEEILGFDLALYDSQECTLGGIDHEFINASRLDNLLSCHAVMTALCGVSHSDATCVAVCYDNEEVGSQTAQGAQSSFLRDILERITPKAENLGVTVARSIAISCDVVHALHPNYPDKHDDHQFPVLGGGPTLKTNSNQRYATDGQGTAFFEALHRRLGIKVQNFVSRSDLACGTTIGPISAAGLGIRTFDIGSPLLSMHSIREISSVSDHLDMINLMSEFFKISDTKITEE